MLKSTPYGEITRIDSARTLAGRGRYWTIAYLVDGLLVDSGCAHSANELVDFLEDKNLEYIVNTHSHEDHIGANGLIQKKRNGLEIFAHPLAVPILKNPRQEQPLQYYRRLLWGWPEPSHANTVQDGEFIKTDKYHFQVVYTPGHTTDHICLYEFERGWLFSGDLFNGSKDRAIRVDTNIWRIIASLKRVADLPLTRLFPGCSRVRDDPRPVLLQKISYLEEIGDKVLRYHERGMGTGAIVRTLFPNPMWIEFITLGHFSRRGLVEAYLQPMTAAD